MLLGIIVATRDEETALRAAMSEKEKVKELNGLLFEKGRLGRHDVVCVRVGVGKVNAAMCTQLLISTFAPDYIINTGVAGAISPDVHPLNVIVAIDAVQHDFDTSYFGDEPGFVSGVDVKYFPVDGYLSNCLVESAKKCGYQVKKGRILTGDQFVNDSKLKKKIAKQFGGSCAEMEGAAIAQVCYINRVPCAILRTISDGAGDDAILQYEEFIKLAVKRAVDILISLEF